MRVIVQVHYNLDVPGALGRRDSTRIRLRLADHVKKRGGFVTGDGLLETMFKGKPDMLPPGQSSTKYTWTQSFEQMGPGGQLELYGVMPHMHQLGHRYRMDISVAGEPAHCAADVKNWDFHWQRLYFYDEPIRVGPESQLTVQCDFDTSQVSEPVLPGWGTRDEMCFVAMYVTVPDEAP
jgi:hypothetical protein